MKRALTPSSAPVLAPSTKCVLRGPLEPIVGNQPPPASSEPAAATLASTDVCFLVEKLPRMTAHEIGVVAGSPK